MNTLTFIFVSAALFLLVSADADADASPKSADSATDISNPIYKNIGLPKDANIVHIKVLGSDTILEEGAEHEVEAKPDGEEKSAPNQEPIVHTLDSVNLPDSEVEAPSVKLADANEEPEAKTSAEALAASAKSYHAHCPSDCSLTRHSCPYGCKAKYCILKYKYPVLKKYRVLVKYTVKYRRHVLVKVRVCKKVRSYSHYGYHTKVVCVIKPHYKWVVYYKTKYRYVIKYKTVYKYKYKTGLKCKGSYY